MLHETPRVSRRLWLPGTRLAQPPSSPAKAWHRCPRQPLSLPASPRGPRARADCFTAAGSAQLPREKAPLFPAPVAPAWLGDTRAPGGKVTGPHRIHLQPHQLPGNRIPAADDSRRRQDRAPIQPLLDGVARPGGRLPNLGPPTPGHRVPRASTAQTARPPAHPGPRPGTEGCDAPYTGCPGQVTGWIGKGAETLPHLQSLTDSRQPARAQGTLQAKR